MNKHENNNKNSVRQKKSSARIVSARNKLLKIDEAIFHPKNEIVDSIRFRKRWLSNTVGNGTLCMEHVNQKLFYRVYEVASVSFDFSWVFFLPFSFSPLFSFSFFSYLFHNFHILSRFFSPSCIGSLFEFRMLFFCFLSFASSLSIYISVFYTTVSIPFALLLVFAISSILSILFFTILQVSAVDYVFIRFHKAFAISHSQFYLGKCIQQPLLLHLCEFYTYTKRSYHTMCSIHNLVGFLLSTTVYPCLPLSTPVSLAES